MVVWTCAQGLQFIELHAKNRSQLYHLVIKNKIKFTVTEEKLIAEDLKKKNGGGEQDTEDFSSICNILFPKRSGGEKISHAKAVFAHYPEGSGEPLKGFKQGNHVTGFAF